MDFVAIDFETANEERASACAVGLAVVTRGAVSEKLARLIRPRDLRFSRRNTAIHGISAKTVENAPEFPDVWQVIRGYIQDGTVLAHSAAFDVRVLTSILDRYGIPLPKFRYLCTVRVARAVWPTMGSYTLASVAGKLRIALDHHNAGEDASACAEIAVRACEKTQCDSIDELAERFGIAFGDPCECCGCKGARERGVRWHTEKMAAEFLPSATDFDPTHPFFRRVIAFTGPLVSMARAEAMQYVADVSGTPADSVTKKTDFLVVGGRYFDIFSHKTGKLTKATQMIANGSDLEIIGEDDFLKMLAE
jgi:DNA polymerase III subunit epsilon